jgi:hypothetical protein
MSTTEHLVPYGVKARPWRADRVSESPWNPLKLRAYDANNGSVVAATSARSMQTGPSFAGELTMRLTG